MFQTLGLRTEALSLTGLSDVEDFGSYIVLRTADEPTFWFGNALIVKGDTVDPAYLIENFSAHFPEANHQCFQWDMPEPPDLSVFPDDYEVQTTDVLTLKGGVARSSLPDGLRLRQLEMDCDWEAALELAKEIGAEDGFSAASHHPFLTRRYENRRRQLADGLGAWFGVFDGDLLVASMGLLLGDGVLRFQEVQTKASHRRRGICAALLGEVCAWGQHRLLDAVPVILVDVEKPAGRIYRRSGFVHAETLGAVVRPSY